MRTAAGRTFGYELTFFRIGLAGAGATKAGPLERQTLEESSPWRASDLLLAHAAVTDVAGRRFLVEKKLERAAHGWAGADTLRMHVWIHEWRGVDEGERFALRVPAASTGGRLGLDVRLRPVRPPVLHGAGGLSPKDTGHEPHASWYTSLPRLETTGTLTVGGESFEVAGLTWMDHEFFTGGLASDQVGWDWFSCRLADGRDLMLLRLRTAAGDTDFSAGTVTSADGKAARAVSVRGVTFQALKRWRSPATGASYPIAWRIRLPAEGLELRSRTPLPEQEVVAVPGSGFTYWEGLTDYTGRWDGKELRGEGYVEMTGYDNPIQLP